MHPAAGGPPIVVERLCASAKEQGWDAGAISTSLYCDDDGRELEAKLRLTMEIEVLPTIGPRALKLTRGLSAIDKGVETADIVHAHTLWHPLNALVRKSCARHGRKYVVMPHGMLDAYSLDQRRWRKMLYMAVAEQRNLSNASRIIYTAAAERAAAAQEYPWLPPAETVALAADRPEADLDALVRSFRARYPEVVGRRCVVFLGRVHPKKGVDRVVSAIPALVDRFPDLLFVIAGGGEAAYLRQLEFLTQSMNLRAHVLFIGTVAGAEKWGALAIAEVFILPSRQENFAISVAEAMHMGAPVIITDKVDSWPMVKAAGAGFVVNDQYANEGIATYLGTLLGDPEKRHRMGMRGQDYARKYLCWSRVSADMIRIYERVLSE